MPKANVNVKIDADVMNFTLDEQIAAATLNRNPQKVKLEADINGNILLDKELHPEIYDWAENG